MANLIDMVRSVITPDIVQTASTATGEHESATQNAINSAIPSILAGVVGMASTTSGADRVMRTISDGGFGDQTINNFSKSLTDKTTRQSLDQSGSSIISSLFGSKADSISDAIGHASGLKQQSSASTLMRFVAPLVMGVLGKQVTSRRLDSRGLMNMMMSEKSAIMAALPPGVGRLLGLEAAHREHAREAGAKAYAEPYKKRNWGPALIGALAVLALLFLLGRRKEHTEVSHAPVQEVSPPAAMPAPAAPSVPMAPTAAPSVTWDEVTTYIAGKGPGGRAFVLEQVTFVPGSARLTPEGKARLAGLAAALKAHPSTHVRIEGTSESGSAAENKKLSKERADAVKAELSSEGVSSSHIDTKGSEANNHRATMIVVKR